MPLSLEHDVLKADLDGAQRALGIKVERHEERTASPGGRVVRVRTLTAALPKPTSIRARFVREGLLERAKKWFVDEVEIGVTWFDDLIFVITSTPEATKALLEEKRVQQALVLLVDPTRAVEIDAGHVRVIDDDAPDDGRDATASLLAIAAHVARRG
jgi:hypothetical protein